MRGRKAGGATDAPPARRASNGKLVMGIKIKMAAQAIPRERLPRRFSLSVMALNPGNACQP
jgi:hypothetical protein